MFSKNSIQLSIAPIAWTNDDLPELGGHITFEQCIDDMAAAGFTGVAPAVTAARIPASHRASILLKSEVPSPPRVTHTQCDRSSSTLAVAASATST